MAAYAGTAAVLLAVWGFSLTPLLTLRRRGMYREFWVTVGLLLGATVGVFAVSGGAVKPVLLPLLSRWIWI